MDALPIGALWRKSMRMADAPLPVGARVVPSTSTMAGREGRREATDGGHWGNEEWGYG